MVVDIGNVQIIIFVGAKFAGNAAIKIAKVDCTDGTNRQLCANQEVTRQFERVSQRINI